MRSPVAGRLFGTRLSYYASSGHCAGRWRDRYQNNAGRRYREDKGDRHSKKPRSPPAIYGPIFRAATLSALVEYRPVLATDRYSDHATFIKPDPCMRRYPIGVRRGSHPSGAVSSLRRRDSTRVEALRRINFYEGAHRPVLRQSQMAFDTLRSNKFARF